MSRPLRPGLVAEGESDCDFLAPLIDRQLSELMFANTAADFDLFRTERSICVKKHGRRRFHDAALELAGQCQILFIHADHNERHEAEQLAAEVRDQVGRCCPVVLVPKRETEAWLLADAGAFRRIRGADVGLLPTNPSDVEQVEDPKRLLKQVMTGGRVDRPSDFFGVLGENVELSVLSRVPAYTMWLAATENALKGLGYL